MGIDYLIINQGGHPVYHDESNPGAYDAATQVRCRSPACTRVRSCWSSAVQLQLPALLSCGRRRRRRRRCWWWVLLLGAACLLAQPGSSRVLRRLRLPSGAPVSPMMHAHRDPLRSCDSRARGVSNGWTVVCWAA
jgi:hypothetical protein